MNLKERAESLKADIPAVYLSLKDRDTPLMAKIFAAITVAYAFSPIDLIPDFIPVLGYLDDIILLPAFVALTIRLIPQDILEKNRKRAVRQEKRWYCAFPIIIIWVCVLLSVLKIAL